MKSVFFGSIGAVAETSEFQRRAYNQALKEAGLDWAWSAATYRQLLRTVGGKARLRMLSGATGAGLSDDLINQIHRRKTELACAAIVAAGVPLRPGVADLARQVKAAGAALGFVTSTYQENIDAIFNLGDDGFSRSDMDVVIGRADVDEGKPAPDVYLAALKATGLSPDDVIAIEDSPSSARAATLAGLKVVITPGAYCDPLIGDEADLILTALAEENGQVSPLLHRALGGPSVAA
ncbi:MAG: HAD-IA family hydrolase [Pseudomonadota bacterium]